ncbi:MAG: UDP-N-acetylmuramoyl-L-alanine--D-glutamate ligase [Eubacteriales bacterium]
MVLNDKKALVVGMAKSGAAAARLLVDLGFFVSVYDAKEENELSKEVLSVLKDLTLEKYFKKDPTEAVYAADLIVISPGVPPTAPVYVLAKKLKKYIISELELGFQNANGDVIAVTGTNGKTTTVSLLGNIFENAGKCTHVVGNIGIPFTQEASKTKKGDKIVAEVSSYQLDDIDTFKPKVSAILNITPDHLNRYKTMENYIRSKSRIFENQTKDDFLVLNYDNKMTRSLSDKAKAKVLWFSIKDEVSEGAYLRDNDIVFKYGGIEKYICNKHQVFIPGEHNMENALAAVCIASVMGVSAQVLRHTLMSFKGVEHRIEFVREVGGVRYINDSKGTNPDATIKAIQAMNAPTVLLLGGYDKKSDFRELFHAFNGYIKAVVALGETAPKILKQQKKCLMTILFAHRALRRPSIWLQIMHSRG